MNFTEFPPCKHRFVCYQCRNDGNFIESMKKRFGEWQCPENIPLGTSLEKMPKHIQDKINAYKNRMQSQVNVEKAKNIQPITSEYKEPVVTQNRSFVDLPMCRQRVVCFECRNNDGFRKRMEEQFGTWQCPENIPINTPLNEMPEKIRAAQESKIKQAEAHQFKLSELRRDIDVLESMVPDHGREALFRVKHFLFPELKNPDSCIHKGASKKVMQVCCGGKEKEVDGFVCVKKGDVTSRNCRNCDSFERKA